MVTVGESTTCAQPGTVVKDDSEAIDPSRAAKVLASAAWCRFFGSTLVSGLNVLEDLCASPSHAQPSSSPSPSMEWVPSMIDQRSHHVTWEPPDAEYRNSFGGLVEGSVPVVKVSESAVITSCTALGADSTATPPASAPELPVTRSLIVLAFPAGFRNSAVTV